MGRQPYFAKTTKKFDAMEWADNAACKDTPIDLWFCEFGDHFNQQAIAICQRCEVKNQCRDYAISRDLTDGIWGGMTPKQREGYAKRKRGKGENDD